jgi:hypothetical protein
MTSKAGGWMIAAGVVVAFLGLCFLPAALGDRSDSGLLAAGASLFSLGTLGMSTGVYLRAQSPQSKAGSGKAPKAPENTGRRMRGTCDLCREEAPVIHCKVHQLHLCGACLAKHYDFRSCVYVPSTRRVEGKSGKSLATKAGG